MAEPHDICDMLDDISTLVDMIDDMLDSLDSISYELDSHRMTAGATIERYESHMMNKSAK